MKRVMVALAFLLALPIVQSSSRPPAVPPIDGAVERKIDSLLALMTLEEKGGQLAQYSARWTGTEEMSRLIPEQEALIRRGKVGSLLNAYGADVTRRIQDIAVKESRMRIPLVFGYRCHSWSPDGLPNSSRRSQHLGSGTDREGGAGRGDGSFRHGNSLDVRSDGRYRTGSPLGPHRGRLGRGSVPRCRHGRGTRKRLPG